MLGSLSIRNPDTGLTVEVTIFESRISDQPTDHPAEDHQVVEQANDPAADPHAQRDRVNPPPEKMDPKLAEKAEFDVFEDLVRRRGGQRFGCAAWSRPSTWPPASGPVHPADNASFGLNFVKGYFGIWTQMVLVIGFAVLFSTFERARGDDRHAGDRRRRAVQRVHGRFGLWENLWRRPGGVDHRLFTQQNVMTEMDPGLTTTVAKMSDYVLLHFLRVVSAVIPSFGDFSYANWCRKVSMCLVT